MDRVEDAAALQRLQEGLDCGECAAWLDGVVGRARQLRGLTRVDAPPELEALVGAACTPRVVRALRDLPRLEAPALLEDRVERECLPVHLARLTSLERQIAPRVLERLVIEELQDPAAARSRRFVGDMPDEEVPEPLWRHAASNAGRGLRRWWRPVAGLAAAVLLWVAIAPVERPETYSFAVVRVRSAAALDPMAQALLGGLNGGFPSDVAEGGARR